MNMQDGVCLAGSQHLRARRIGQVQGRRTQRRSIERGQQPRRKGKLYRFDTHFANRDRRSARGAFLLLRLLR